MTMKIKLNPSFKGAYKCKDRYRVLYGGAGSGKSYYMEQETIVNMLSSGKYQYLVVRKTGRSIRESVFRGIVSKINQYNLGHLFRINKSEMSIVCSTGSSLITSGLDDVEKLKSVSGINRIWIEEASEITQEDFEQLDLRIRGGSKVGHQITLTFNPINELHWLKKYFFDLGEGNPFILKTTYLNNPFLDDEYIKTLNRLKATNEHFYNIYALGKWGSLGGLVYSNWEKRDLSDIKDGFDNIFNGVDFGFADDPTTLVRAHYDKTKKKVYIFDEMYRKELFIDELARLLKEIIGNQLVTCDSAEPRSIADLKRNGIRAIAAKKGPDSVEHGIGWIQSNKIIVDERCTNTIQELSSYRWRKDKNDNILPKPVDDDNHILDALRYGLESEMVRSGRMRTISKSALGL